jgi:hypothetical protein
VGAVRGGSRDFQGPDGGHRRDELVSIAVRGGLARACDRDAVGTSRIGERSELPVCLLFKLPVGDRNEGVRLGPGGYKALCDFLGLATGEAMKYRWSRESGPASGADRPVRQVSYEHPPG